MKPCFLPRICPVQAFQMISGIGRPATSEMVLWRRWETLLAIQIVFMT